VFSSLVSDKLHRIGKFYVFLREIRVELFDEAFEAELAAACQQRGVTPLPLALVTLLPAYDQVGGAVAAPVKFRARMIAHNLYQKLLDRTVALSKQTGRFGWQALGRARFLAAHRCRPRRRHVEFDRPGLADRRDLSCGRPASLF
jgi:hypothetical protein